MKKPNEPQDVTIEEINQTVSLLKEIKLGKELSSGQIKALDFTISIVESFISIVHLLNKKNSSIKKLKKFLFGSQSEKSSKINDDENKGTDSEPESDTDDNADDNADGNDEGNNADDNDNDNDNDEGKALDKEKPEAKPPEGNNKKERTGGTGKNSHEKYTGAVEVLCPLHDTQKPGEICPSCNDFKLQDRPPVIKIKLMGAAPISAFKFIIEKSLCLCGALFKGTPPEDLKDILDGKKFSPSALASIITQKFDMGVPYGGLAKLQDLVGVPVPSSTQANKIKDLSPVVEAVFDVLEIHAANVDVIGFDDTRIKILKAVKLPNGKFKDKNGHASVFVCKNIGDARSIILYNLNLQHAGLYLKNLLTHRVNDMESLICICDGLPAYIPYAPENAINSNCNVHSRRNFVYEKIAEADFFSKKMIELYKEIFKNEKHCREENLSANERLLYHQKMSTASMDMIINLCYFMVKDINIPYLNQMRNELSIPEYIVPCEPNSDLYRSAQYILKRKEELSNFLKFPGVPLDTNEIERMVKAVIEIRKKGFFFQTEKSALFSGKILSIIETAQANKINSFAYFEFIIKHEKEVVASPSSYLPWNYQETKLYQSKQFSSKARQVAHVNNPHS